MLGLNARFRAGFVKPLQTFVQERFDHEQNVARCASRNKASTEAGKAEDFELGATHRGALLDSGSAGWWGPIDTIWTRCLCNALK